MRVDNTMRNVNNWSRITADINPFTTFDSIWVSKHNWQSIHGVDREKVENRFA